MNLITIFCLFACVSAEKFVDINDILNDDYMPGSLLLIEGVDNPENGRNVSFKPAKIESITGGSIIEAYNTMGFHRKMMNEYLCRSFVADQILTDMSLTRVRRRLGAAVSPRHRLSNNNNNNTPSPEKDSIKENLFTDEGSSKYKHWLQKSTTLEDIYRRYEQMQDRGIDDHDGDDNDPEEYEGEVTGYALQAPHGAHGAPLPQRPIPSKVGYGHSGGGGGYPHSAYPSGGGHSGYGSSGHGGGYDYVPQHVHYYQGNDHEEHGKGDKDVALADLFDIALTAIAFLSFGCFLIQVIMCITNTTTTTTTTAVTMMPMTMTVMTNDAGDDGDTTDDGYSEPDRIRYKRDASGGINDVLNDLARRVLLSIESALVVDDDDGNCLRQQLCENNKHSRSLKDSQKIWVPAWSFAMSWLTGRLNSRVPPATSMLDSLKASILGLGNANCKLMYSNCKLPKLREMRRRKRRKRSAEKGTNTVV